MESWFEQLLLSQDVLNTSMICYLHSCDNILSYLDSSELGFSLAGIYTNMQFSYRLLTTLYLSVTITQSQLFPEKSEGGGEVLQSFRLGSSEFAPADSISPERFQFESGATLNADLSQPPSDPKQPVPVAGVRLKIRSSILWIYISFSRAELVTSPSISKTRGKFWPDEIETLLRLVFFVDYVSAWDCAGEPFGKG